MEALTEFILAASGSPWIYLLVFAVCVIDGFFPPIPSESVIVALASLAVSTGVPTLWLLILIGAVGAIVGDNIAFTIGQRVGTDRFAWMRRPRIAKTFEWARRGLDKRGAVLILTARYVPVGRVAVNMSAGATGMSRRRFLSLSILAGASWAAYSVLIGVVAGHWVHDNPILGAGVAIVIAMVIGFGIDLISSRIRERRETSQILRSADRTPVG